LEQIIKYLSEAEGTLLHRLKNEKDITSPYGIHKNSHPNASIFKYLDNVALQLGIVGNSKNWNESDIRAINKKMDSGKIKELAIGFYTDFLEDVHIKLFPKECEIAMFSMFTNSPLNAWKAVQESINNFVESGHIAYKLQEVDGAFGDDTKNGLAIIKDASVKNPLFGFLFESQMIFEMSRIYAKLVAKNPKDYLQYLVGWNNRIDKLLDIR